MAIGRITGPMLFSNLDRQGVNLAIDTNLVYIDVSNRRLGVGNTSPGYTLDVNGNAHLGNLYILGNTITSETGKIGLGAISNIVVTGGSPNFIVYTDGNGNLSFGNISTLANAGNFYGNTITLGANSSGSLSSLFTWPTTTTVTTAVAQLNQVLGNITNTSGTNIGVTGNVTSSNVIITNTLNSTSNSSGALTVAGGASVQKDLWVGGNVYVANLISDQLSILSISEPLLYLNASNPSTYNYETGFFGHFVGGSGNYYQHTGVVRNHNDNIWYFFSNTPEPAGSTVDLANSRVILDTVKAGGLILANTTPSTSTGSGALQVSGGAGIVGALWITNTNDVSANIGSVIGTVNTFNANLGAYQINTNANIGAIFNHVNTLDANVALYETYANTQISTINANLGSYEINTNANIGTITNNLQTLNANVGAYEIYSNANAATQSTSINTFNANLGAYQLYANANAGTITTTVNTFNANLGAYQIYANANAVAQATAIATLQAGTYSNSNVAAYLPLYSGNLNVYGLQAGIFAVGSLNVDTIYSNTSGVVTIGVTTALGLPIGGNSARPASPAAGQIRFNSDLNTLEFYAGTGGWMSMNNTITDQQFFGDGTNTIFTLNQASNNSGILVSINGTIQQPGTAYSVSGTQITFAEIPLATDLIDVRFLASATTAIYNNIDIDSAPITVTTGANTIIDAFSTTTTRSVKYTISSVTPYDAHMAEVHVTQFGGAVTLTSYGILNTGANTITYYANIAGSTVRLLANGTTSSQVRVQRIYFNN